jgi:hypothetical protein
VRERCYVCGQTEADHHAFVSFVPVVGCKCDPYSWRFDGEPMRPVCPSFVEWSAEAVSLYFRVASHCQLCEHNRECHKPEPPR